MSLNKDPDVVSEQAPLIILDVKSDICMYNIGNYTKHTRHISIKMHFLRNGEEWNLYKTVWFEGGILLVDIVKNNIREDKLNLY